MPPIEVFLSHASSDAPLASQLAETLRAHSVPTFYSPTNILGAQQWQNEILSALQRCEWFLVLLSPDSVDSMWVRRETALALADERYENRIVPLMYRPCDLGMLEWLKLFQIIDFSRDYQASCRDLLKIRDLKFRE